MRQWSDVMDYRPMLIGTIGAESGGSMTGNAIDLHGFADVMAVITYGCLGGTKADQGYISFRFDESDTFGTGASYARIGDGQINGSMQIDTVYGTALTYPFLASTTIYERWNGAIRKRYLRVNAVYTGTAGMIFGFTVGALCGRPRNTLYLAKATVFGSNVDECFQPRATA